MLLSWCQMSNQQNLDSVSVAVGAIALTCVRNRICAPRDMSAGAATTFRAAADQVLLSIPSERWHDEQSSTQF